MHSDGSLNAETERFVFGFLRCKRRGKLHISSEITEFERLRSLPSPHTSPVPVFCNTSVKFRRYYLSESTVQQLPTPLPVNIMAKTQARTPNLTINTDTANDTGTPSKQDADFLLPAVYSLSPPGVSLHKSRSMGAIGDKARPLKLSPTRNELLKPEHSLTEANESAHSSSESPSNDVLDDEELLQAKFNKLLQIGRERGYDDDDVRQCVKYALEHSLIDPKTGSEVDFEVIKTEVDCNKAKVPEFSPEDPAVKEIERHYLEDVFGQDIVSSRQLILDNQYTSDELAASSGPGAIYLHSNSDIASHTTLKAHSPNTMSPCSSSAASHSNHLPTPKIEQSHVASSGGSDYKSATPEAGPVWFREDMVDGDVQDSSDIGFKAKDTVAQKQEQKVMGTSAIEHKQHQGAFNPSKLTESRLGPGTYRTPNGLIPLLLPLRYNKVKLHDGGQSSATGRSTPLDQKRKEQLAEATATLASLADRPNSTDSYEDQTYGSLIDSSEDKQSEAAHLSGIASTSNSDSPTLGYAHLSTPSSTLRDIYTPTSSRLHPRSLPSFSPSANSKMKMPPKNGPGKFKVSPRNVSLPSPCDKFSESSINSRRRESTVVTKWDEEMRYANERVGHRN